MRAEMRRRSPSALAAAYRRRGADAPFGDPRRWHGAAMEGHFWRLTDAARGGIVIVIAAVCRDRTGAPWAMVSLAAHPGGLVTSADVESAWAASRGFAIEAGDVLHATTDALTVALPQAALDVRFESPVRWPRRAFGALGPAQVVPGLSQYWHPWLLGARVRGTLTTAAGTIALDGASAYAEKNWGAGGMPPAWWWGQAHGFERDEVCVAFAGGHAGIGSVRVPAGALVVRIGDRLITVVRPPRALRVGLAPGHWQLRGGGVEVDAEAGGAPHLLPVPVPAERQRIDARAPQYLTGTLALRVRRRGRLLFAGESQLAGLEQGRGHQLEV